MHNAVWLLTCFILTQRCYWLHQSFFYRRRWWFSVLLQTIAQWQPIWSSDIHRKLVSQGAFWIRSIKSVCSFKYSNNHAFCYSCILVELDMSVGRGSFPYISVTLCNGVSVMHHYLPYSGYFSRGCNLRLSWLSGICKKLTCEIHDDYPHVCSSTDSSVHETRHCYNSQWPTLFLGLDCSCQCA